MKRKDYILLLSILLIGFFFRTYNLNWDSGIHLHPDERAIVLFALPLHLPKTLPDFFSPESPLNPHFFAYGSFPLYLLKITSVFAGLFNKSFADYTQINLLGRFISALFDTATIGVVFLIGKKLFSKNMGFISASFYALSVLSIQLSHFFAVDTLLTFFMMICLYMLISHYQNPSLKKSFLIGSFWGLGMATKTSAIALTACIGITLAADFLLIFLKQPHKPKIWFPHVPHIIKTLFTEGIVIFVTGIIVFFVFEPYAFLDFSNFWIQTKQQSQMTYNAFTFPYTLQFVGKIPYWYELKNIFLWGLGPFTGVFSLIGLLYFTFLVLKKEKHSKWASELIAAVFFWSYFLVVGKFAIGYMRYMLPVYPLLSLFAALILYRLTKYLHLKLKIFHLDAAFYLLLTIFFLLWPLSFMHIYTKPNTRILATDWINNSLPPGKTLAVEHWDDGLPLTGQEKYNMITLPLYDPDTQEKWRLINEQIKRTDYIILASNRLYAPLQRLTDCQKLGQIHCYPYTANYYRMLFSGQLGFRKIAEFAVYPTIPFLNIAINDQNSDESFTVFDHPKVMIFERSR